MTENIKENTSTLPPQLDAVTEACRSVARQVREAYRNLEIHYIVHHSGQRREALAMAAQEILIHPAAETALHILQKVRRSEDSAILGTAVARKRLFFGLAGQDTMLSLCTINLEQFRTVKEARRYAWHLAWHAIDAYTYHAKPENRMDTSDIILRRRNALELTAANLRADVFSAIISTLYGDSSATQNMGMMRGLNALQTRSLHNPEFYPFVLAKEATDFMSQELSRQSPPKKRFVNSALRAASDIGRTIDIETLRQWLAFSEPAQDMAWRGYSPPDILGAAINTSDDTSVRATGYMVAELTGIESTSMLDAKNIYSPFADDAFNERLHEKAVEAVFEDVIAQGMRQRSSAPFILVANTQNESLTEGHILGWCASALQTAGRAFQRTLDSGNNEVDPSVRREFDGERTSTSWSDLCAIGKDVVHQYRQGNIVTLSRVDQLCGDDKAFASIRKAILNTMRDPSYQRKLSATRELAQDLSQRRSPSPETAPRMKPAVPAPAMAATPGGMGGSGGGAVPRQHPLAGSASSLPDKSDGVQDQAEA